MTRKQKKMLIRICISAALLAVLHFLPEDFPRFPGAEEGSLLRRFPRMLLYHRNRTCYRFMNMTSFIRNHKIRALIP